MSSLFGTISTLMTCGTIFAIAFLVLLAMPQSELRAVLMPIVGWVFALICGVYCISPVDVIPEALLGPFGLVDDIGAAIAGISAARAAMNANAA